jgi:serine phosphatase RsbU (regulator of sigma subunit)
MASEKHEFLRIDLITKRRNFFLALSCVAITLLLFRYVLRYVFDSRFNMPQRYEQVVWLDSPWGFPQDTLRVWLSYLGKPASDQKEVITQLVGIANGDRAISLAELRRKYLYLSPASISSDDLYINVAPAGSFNSLIASFKALASAGFASVQAGTFWKPTVYSFAIRAKLENSNQIFRRTFHFRAWVPVEKMLLWLSLTLMIYLVTTLSVRGTTTLMRNPQRPIDLLRNQWMRISNQLRKKSIIFEIEEARHQMEELFPQKKAFKRSGIHIAHRRIQTITISGDFYNFIPRSDESFGIYFVDVEGQGLFASNQARSLYQALTVEDWGMENAGRELEKADELVRQGAIFQKEEAAFCMNFTEIDPKKMEIRHANAGMPFPLLFKRGEAEPHILRAAGVYVGAGYSNYPVKPKMVVEKVGDGDLLVIASDGILEARDSRGRIFGQKGITAAVYRTRDKSPEEIADEIIWAVQKHTGKEEPDDGQTLVIVQIGQPVVETHLVELKTLEKRNGVFSLMNAGDTGSVCHNELRKQLKTWAQSQGFADQRRITQVWAATWEAIQNAVKFGSKSGDVIHIRLIPPGQEGFLEVEMTQPLLWEDWDKCLGNRRKEEVNESGQILMGGTVVMLWLADEIRVTDLGRRIIMRFSSKVAPQRKVSPEMHPRD